MHWRTEQMIAGYKRNSAGEPTDQNRGNLLGEPKKHMKTGGKTMYSKGSIEIEGTKVEYWVKHFEEGSEFGIENGGISKLQCKVAEQTILNYDRGWNIEPDTELAHKALAILVEEYN